MRSTTISTDPRRRRLALYGGAGAAASLLALTLVQRDLPEAQPAPPLPVIAEPIQAPPSPPATPATPAVSPDGLRLHGLTATGAIISGGDGAQRLVRVGRDVMPGLVLERVEQHRAVLRSGANRYLLGFEGATAAPGDAPTTTSQAAPATGGEDTLRYRLGLAPVRQGDRVIGHTIRVGAEIPALARAGLRPGDTILSVNGSVLDEERMMELAWTIANSEQTEFEVRREGRTMRMAIR